MSETLPECVGDVPNICGREDLILDALARTDPRPSSDSHIDFARIRKLIGQIEREDPRFHMEGGS